MMRVPAAIFILMICFLSCAKQPKLPLDSKYSVTAMRNDSTWFATAKAIRLFPKGQEPTTSKQFNLQIITDIDFPGNGSPSTGKSPYVTGCVEGSDCVPTQRLHIYNIPLKRGKYRIFKLDRRRKVDLERTNYWLMVDGSGVMKHYLYQGRKPGWIRVTNYDKRTNMVEGRFSIDLDENLNSFNRLVNSIPPVAAFREGLFWAKLVDVGVK